MKGIKRARAEPHSLPQYPDHKKKKKGRAELVQKLKTIFLKYGNKYNNKKPVTERNINKKKNKSTFYTNEKSTFSKILFSEATPVALQKSISSEKNSLSKIITKAEQRLKRLTKYIVGTSCIQGPINNETRTLLKNFEENLINPLLSIQKTPFKANKKVTERINNLKNNTEKLKEFIDKTDNIDFRSTHNFCTQLELYHNLTERLSKEITSRKKRDIFKKKCIKEINRVKDKHLNQKNNPKATIVDGCRIDSIPTLLKLQKKIKTHYKTFCNSSKERRFNTVLIEALSAKAQEKTLEFPAFTGNKWVDVKLTYTPAHCMRLPFSSNNPDPKSRNQRDPFATSMKGRFAPSLERNTEHAVNLQAYTMELDGKVQEKYIRVGSPWAYAEPLPEKKQARSEKRIDEILTAVLVHCKPELIERAKHSADEPIELDIVYHNLMSPDSLRSLGIAKAVGQNNEKDWIKDMEELFKQIATADAPRKLTIYSSDGKPIYIKLKPKIHMLVTPCNLLGLNKRLAHVAHTWDDTVRINSSTLKSLVGERNSDEKSIFGQKKASMSQNSIDEVEAIKKQLWHIIDHGLEQDAQKRNPFHFPQKVRKLLTLLDIPLFTGCKSNKDRTGLSEAHHQSALLGGDKLLTEQFIVYGGHIDIQMQNTGLPGYRIDATAKNFLGPEIFKAIQRSEKEKRLSSNG